MDFLKCALIGNTFFSLATGLCLALYHKTISQWFGKQRSTPFSLIGFGLIGFAASLFLIIKNPEPKWVWTIIVLDLLWVLGSIAILIFKPFGLSVKGHRIITGVALIVMLFATGQFLGIR